jgi:outer membrane protein OmpA-like peptidoglycan-associated protein
VTTPYFESSASITGDGKILYFVSERLGGYGRGDIYRCVRGASGDWGPAENLGPLINTEEDEICSFISSDGKTLYFSSRGHLSMGGYDIFKTTFENGKWTAPVNMGYPVNTTEDDLHFVISNDSKSAFYSAIREGGFGDRDIYSIDLSLLNAPKTVPMKMVVIKGSVEDDEGKTTDAEVQVVDAASGKPVGMFRTTASGKYIASVQAGSKYNIVVQKTGFEIFQEEINIANTSDTATVINIDKIIRLQRIYEKKKEETEVFKYILFELASSDLKLDEASKVKLDNVIKYIRNNPKLHVKLAGHTDIIGEEGYNRQLSVKRAQVVAAYMKSKGLSAGRISLEGFGADKPVQSNDTEDGRKMNRRVELEVVEK